MTKVACREEARRFFFFGKCSRSTPRWTELSGVSRVGHCFRQSVAFCAARRKTISNDYIFTLPASCELIRITLPLLTVSRN